LAEGANDDPLVGSMPANGAAVRFILEVLCTEDFVASIAGSGKEILLVAIRVRAVVAAIAEMSHGCSPM